MKNILRAFTLCASMFCYSADHIETKPNHIIGVAGATGHSYAMTRGFIDNGATYACAIAHTRNSSLNKDMLQQIAHEIFKKQIEGETTSLFSTVLGNNKVKLPQPYDINLIYLTIVNQKTVHQKYCKVTRWQTGHGVAVPDLDAVHLDSRPYQSFKINLAGLIPTDSSTNLSIINNSDDIAQQIAYNRHDLDGELIVVIRTAPIDRQASMCMIS